MFFKFSRLAALRRRFRTARLAALCFRWRFPAAAEALCATFRCGALAHARFAALWRRSRLRPARRPLFPAAVYGGGKGSLCDLPAALSLTLGSPPSVSVRRFPAALSPAPGSPLCCGALARARLAALWRRSRSRSAAALWRRSRSRSVRRPLFRCGGFRRRSRLRPVRRFVAALSLAPGSPLCGGAPARARLPLCGGALAHARFAALRRRSRSRSVRRFAAALSLTLGSPPVLPVLKAVLKKCPRSFFEHGQSP